jgi:hypothetical protein
MSPAPADGAEDGGATFLNDRGIAIHQSDRRAMERPRE